MIEDKKTSAGGNRTEALASRLSSLNSTRRHFEKQSSFADVNRAALAFLPALLGRWLPGGVVRGREYIARNPQRVDRQAGSFKVNIRTGRWSDFATGDRGGDVISLAAYLFSLRQGEALRRVAGMLGVRHD